MSLAPGAQLGPYRIEDTAGVGGMGEVYRARDTRLDRTVAIKVLPTHLSERPELRQRFDREAKTVSSLQHPYICALFDVGHENGVDFLVMEYLEGKTLAERLEDGPLPPDELFKVGVQITEALEAAHRQGVIHRDLKPGNIMLTRAGVKLLDFGLAKTVEAALGAHSGLATLAAQPESGTPLTTEGTVLGTFQYMSPEQLEGKEADARSDIFSLGAVLYEMATGRRAFEGKSQASLIASIMSSQPAPISTIASMTPPALDRVVRTCLEKDPENRWQTAHDVALQLKWIAEGGSQVGLPKPVAARRRSRERLAWILAGGAAAAAVALAAALLLRPAPEPPTAVRFRIDAPPELISFGSPRISPDGKHIAFDGVDTTGTTQVWVRALGDLEMHPLPGTESTTRPFWSADSRNLAFFSGGKLKRVPLTGGPPVTICEVTNGSDGSWGSTGMILFDGRNGDSIQVVSAGGGVPGPATTLDRANGENTHGWPFFLPDGTRFVFLAMRNDGSNEIRLGELGSMDTKLLTQGESRVEYIAPGYLTYERNGILLAQAFDVGRGELTGDPFPLAEGIGTGQVGLAHFSGSNDGTLLYTGGGSPERGLQWFDRDGRPGRVVVEPKLLSSPTLSPDGTRVVLEIDDEQGSPDLWIVDLGRRLLSRFTFDPAADSGPSWSPDGSRIAFRSGREPVGIYVKSASGTGNAEAILKTPSFTSLSNWTRDGRTLIANQIREGTSWDVVSIPLEGDEEPRALLDSRFNEGWPALSPDERILAYVSYESGTPEIYLTTYPALDGKWQVSQGGGVQPRWRREGGELYYLSVDRRMMAVDVRTGSAPDIGVPHALFQAPVPRDLNERNHYDVTPDGQRFLLVTTSEANRVPPLTVVLHWEADLSGR